MLFSRNPCGFTVDDLSRLCFIAGCNKQVNVSVLVSDSRLIRDLQELKRNKRGGRNTQHAEDYTALDDED